MYVRGMKMESCEEILKMYRLEYVKKKNNVSLKIFCYKLYIALFIFYIYIAPLH